TSNAAAMLGLDDEIGALRPGVVADVTVLADERGRWVLRDNEGTQVSTERMLRPLFCLRAGKRFDADAPILPTAQAAGDLAVADKRQALLAADVIDDLQDAFAVRAILDAKFLHEARIVDQVVARELRAASLLLEGDLGIGQELAHEIGQFAKADRLAAGVV